MEDLLTPFFTKLAMMGLSTPGMARSVGRFNPMNGAIGRPPHVPGVKQVTARPPQVINPRRNLNESFTAFTSMKSAR